MAFLHYSNVRIAGIAAGVPKIVKNNLIEENNVSKEYTLEEFVKTTGVVERHVSKTLCTSDLCYEAAEKLIADLQWEKSDIEVLVFVSQTSDYLIPSTACILQHRLGLSKECMATDCTLGCSGWVYGLGQVLSLVATGEIKKALLLAGDAKNLADGPSEKLFGYAGTATAVEYCEGAKDFKFHFGTDGSGYDAIIKPDGGARNVVSSHSFEFEEIDGKIYNRLMLQMNGMDVFSFAISTAPKSVKRLAEHFEFDYQDADYYVFHQANLKINNMITKKLKLDESKVPLSLSNFGNTSSASIPLTIVSQLRDKLQNSTKFICCGFGVGLSWGTVAFEIDNIVIPNLILVDELEE